MGRALTLKHEKIIYPKNSIIQKIAWGKMEWNDWVKIKQQETESYHWSYYKVNWSSKAGITKENIILEKKVEKLSKIVKILDWKGLFIILANLNNSPKKDDVWIS